MKTKLYKVQIGIVEDGTDYHNYNSVTVIAKDLPGALKRVKLKKNEYIAAAELVSIIDKP